VLTKPPRGVSASATLFQTGANGFVGTGAGSFYGTRATPLLDQPDCRRAQSPAPSGALRQFYGMRWVLHTKSAAPAAAKATLRPTIPINSNHVIMVLHDRAVKIKIVATNSAVLTSSGPRGRNRVLYFRHMAVKKRTKKRKATLDNILSTVERGFAAVAEDISDIKTKMVTKDAITDLRREMATKDDIHRLETKLTKFEEHEIDKRLQLEVRVSAIEKHLGLDKKIVV
jgi:hypothetical protein